MFILVLVITTLRNAQFISAVKYPKRDCIWDRMFGPCREVGPILEVFTQIHCMSL